MTLPTPGSGEGVTATSTCYRHPGRETYIRCSRCERPICPDCMRDAPVGFQCPECVGSGTVRTRTPVGGAVARRPDAVTLTLIAVNVVAFLLQLASPAFERRFFGANFLIAVQHEYYRLVTASFLHVGWWHIALNMYALYLMGPPLERLLGWWRFLGLYLVSGLAGGVTAYVLTGPGAVVEGASGSIFGLFAAMWVLSRRFGADTSQITTLIAINFAISFFFAHISWQGHLGGFIGGGLIALAYAYAPRRSQALLHAGALVAVAGLAMVAALLRTAALT
ncbi:MAG: rhomboid family intramembrane serine protease [Frankiaceae bacterium]